MTNLLKTEWLKMRNYRAFWWLMGLTALAYPGINFIFQQIYKEFLGRKDETSQILKALLGNPFTFPEVWHTIAYASSLLVFIPAVLVIMFVTNEYTYKTHRQNIIDGWSRSQFMTSKMLDILIVTITITIIYTIVTLIIGFLNVSDAGINKWDQFYYIGLFALQTFAQLSLAFMLGFLIKKAFIALGAFLFYFLILENVMIGLMHYWKVKEIAEYFPLEISDRLVPVPSFVARIDKEGYERSLTEINPHILYTVILTAIIWWICFRINNKKDL